MITDIFDDIGAARSVDIDAVEKGDACVTYDHYYDGEPAEREWLCEECGYEFTDEGEVIASLTDPTWAPRNQDPKDSSVGMDR
jgi:hypothetical protein